MCVGKSRQEVIHSPY